jgi:hypothetical protein
MNYLVGEEILISDQADIQNFGHYRIGSYTVDPSNSNFYLLTIAELGSNGAISIQGYYDMVNFALATSSAGDKTFTYVQSVPAMVWGDNGVVTHTLNKFPSISIVDSAGSVVTGAYTYIDDNNITLNFSAPFAGKAYLN